MGSVKDLITPDNVQLFIDAEPGKERALRAAAELYRSPTEHDFGMGVWLVSGRFSVKDLKKIIPEVEIPQKRFVLAMTAAAYMEHAESAGIPTCYIGMLDNRGVIVPSNTLLENRELSDLVVMQLANVPNGNADSERAAFHAAVQDGTITTHVADAEFIFRRGVPLGSSIFERIFSLMGQGKAYAKLATYDETVKGLNALRTTITSSGIDAFPELKDYLATLGLAAIPNPGTMLPQIVYNLTTKFARGGDRDITPEELRTCMGWDEALYADVMGLVQRCAKDQITYCHERGIENVDGKLEIVVNKGKPYVADFACTPDENRLMVVYNADGVPLFIPTSKQIQRDIFKHRGTDAAISSAHEDYGDDWPAHLAEFVNVTQLKRITDESVRLMSAAIGHVGNLLLGKNVFDAQPIETWVHDFLPYASRLQDAQLLQGGA